MAGSCDYDAHRRGRAGNAPLQSASCDVESEALGDIEHRDRALLPQRQPRHHLGTGHDHRIGCQPSPSVGLDHRTAVGQHIANPVGPVTVGQRDDEACPDTVGMDGGPVRPATAASQVNDHRGSAGTGARDAQHAAIGHPVQSAYTGQHRLDPESDGRQDSEDHGDHRGYRDGYDGECCSDDALPAPSHINIGTILNAGNLLAEYLRRGRSRVCRTGFVVPRQ